MLTGAGWDRSRAAAFGEIGGQERLGGRLRADSRQSPLRMSGVYLRLRSAVFLSMGLCLFAVGVQAQGATHEFNVPAQSAVTGIPEFARQAGIQILVAESLVRGKDTAPVVGTYTVAQGLKMLLAGTALVPVAQDERTLTLALRGATGETDPQSPPGARPPDPQPRSSLQLAQAAPGPNQGSASVETSDDRGYDKKKRSEVLQEVVVTGSHLQLTNELGPQAVTSYSSDQIQQSGQTNIADFFDTLPAVSVSNPETGSINHALGGTTIQLRGLPVGTTLVLIDGHRVEASGGQVGTFFDLNNIPLAAVDRIDVLSDGASAIYGSDAIAGVVNVILKRDLDRFEVSTKYGVADDVHESDSALAWGSSWDRAHLSVVGSYQSRSSLSSANRALTATNDYSSYGGPNNNLPACNPGNVFSVDGNNLPGLSAPYAAVPPGFKGTPSIAEFAATQGTLNQCPLFGAVTSLIPATQRAAVLVTGDYQVTSSASLFADLLYAHITEHFEAYPAFLFGTPGAGNQAFTVGPANPYNPFGTTVGIGYRFPGINITTDPDTDFIRPLLGLRGTIGRSWSWELSFLQSQDWTAVYSGNYVPDNAAIQNALNSSDPSTALNPFVDGAPASSTLVQSFFQTGLLKFGGRNQDLNGIVRGPILSLPAGDVQAALGFEYSRDRIYSNVLLDPYTAAGTQRNWDRRTSAEFAEFRVPILAASETRASGGQGTRETLAVTAAVRRDDYSDFGSTTNPQLGLQWRPVQTLLVRASYADAFKAPTLYDLYNAQQTFPSLITDPRTGQPVTVPVTIGGNPSLKPQKGEDASLAIVYSSETISGLKASVTDWRVKETNTIQGVFAQYLVDNESDFPGRVTRDPVTGAITFIDDTSVNFGSLNVAGIDYHIAYSRPTPGGEWTGSLTVAQIYRYLAELVPGGPALERVAIADDSTDWAPRWKGTASVEWKRSTFSANVTGRYVGRYQDYDTTRELGNFWLCDAHFRMELGEHVVSGSPALKGVYVELGGVNLFNRLPQYSNYQGSFIGYDPSQGDIRGRFLYAQLGVKL